MEKEKDDKSCFDQRKHKMAKNTGISSEKGAIAGWNDTCGAFICIYLHLFAFVWGCPGIFHHIVTVTTTNKMRVSSHFAIYLPML
jgi:hypothetical protein